MWKYTISNCKFRCDYCGYDCRPKYMDALRFRGYTMVSCQFSFSESSITNVPKFLVGVIRASVINIIVVKNGIFHSECRNNISINRLTPNIVDRIDYIPDSDGSATYHAVYVY